MNYFAVNAGVCQGWFHAATVFSNCIDHILVRMKSSGCGVSFGKVRITDLDLADDAVIQCVPLNRMKSEPNCLILLSGFSILTEVKGTIKDTETFLY